MGAPGSAGVMGNPPPQMALKSPATLVSPSHKPQLSCLGKVPPRGAWQDGDTWGHLWSSPHTRDDSGDPTHLSGCAVESIRSPAPSAGSCHLSQLLPKTVAPLQRGRRRWGTHHPRSGTETPHRAQDRPEKCHYGNSGDTRVLSQLLCPRRAGGHQAWPQTGNLQPLWRVSSHLPPVGE